MHSEVMDCFTVFAMTLFFHVYEAPPQAPAYADNALIIDIPTPGEFASGHVDGALNLPMDNAETQGQSSTNTSGASA